MHFRPRPDATTGGRSAIDLHADDGRHVATIYAQPHGLHVICEPGYEPADLAVEAQQPAGVYIGLLGS